MHVGYNWTEQNYDQIEIMNFKCKKHLKYILKWMVYCGWEQADIPEGFPDVVTQTIEPKESGH